MQCLVDVNVWIPMAFDRHSHHSVARGWFDARGDGSCCFCRMTQQGFLRLSSNRKIMGDAAVAMADAWRMYDALSSERGSFSRSSRPVPRALARADAGCEMVRRRPCGPYVAKAQSPVRQLAILSVAAAKTKSATGRKLGTS